jgi:hypothetical protein
MINFLGIGTQKAGTTWVYEVLRHHNDVFFPPMKEVHFWDGGCYAQGVDWYNNLFVGGQSKVTGEITPSYGFIPHNKIKEIYGLYPDLKLFYLVRNPTDRAWSSALMALKRSEMTINEASDQWFIDHFKSNGSIIRGDYLNAIGNWTSVFPKKQFLLLQYEDIAKNPAEIMTKICNHIGVEASIFVKENHDLLEKKIFSGLGHKIRPQLKKFLDKLYNEKNTVLAEEHGVDYR